MDLSIIIVNWNSKDILQQCLYTVFTQTQGVAFEVIVIDSASFDGCGEMLRKHYPQVRFIQCKKNIGFAEANNTAYSVSRGRNLLFLNPDTEVEGSAINTLLSSLESLPHAGLVGAKLLNSDRSVQTTCIRTFPNILNQILDAEVLQGKFPHSRLWGIAPLLNHSTKPVEVDAVSGACLMTKRALFETVKMFDTDYFMYSEDIDLCYKVRKVGWEIYYVPTAVILHHGGKSSGLRNENSFSNVMMMESRWRFFKKTRARWYCWFYRLSMIAVSAARVSLLFLVTLVMALQDKASPVERSLKNWIAKLRWSLGLESWIKNYFDYHSFSAMLIL